MIVSNAPVLSDVHVICDWLEFSVLCSQYGTISFESVKREWDKVRNQEDCDPEGGDNNEEEFFERVKSEILGRQELLADAYPFQLSATGNSLEQKVDLTFGNASYLLCLILSHPKKDEVLSGSYIPKITNVVRDYFQVISTLAAAGEVDGNSFSFGFPRPDRSGFLQKLTQIYSHFGESTLVVQSVPIGAPRSVKDAQIDIIAWRSRSDSAAGKFYLLGQVASGNNWNVKSIKGGPIESFHQLWFQRSPGSTSIAAMYVPICFGNLIDGANKAIIDARVYEFGHIFYRFNIPNQAGKGVDLANNNPNLKIERINDINKIIQWVKKQIKTFKTKSIYATVT